MKNYVTKTEYDQAVALIKRAAENGQLRGVFGTYGPHEAGFQVTLVGAGVTTDPSQPSWVAIHGSGMTLIDGIQFRTEAEMCAIQQERLAKELAAAKECQAKDIERIQKLTEQLTSLNAPGGAGTSAYVPREIDTIPSGRPAPLPVSSTLEDFKFWDTMTIISAVTVAILIILAIIGLVMRN